MRLQLQVRAVGYGLVAQTLANELLVLFFGVLPKAEPRSTVVTFLRPHYIVIPRQEDHTFVAERQLSFNQLLDKVNRGPETGIP